MPTLLIKALLGPVVRKKPPARSYIIRFIRNIRVLALRRKVFLAIESGGLLVLLLRREDVEYTEGVRVPYLLVSSPL